MISESRKPKKPRKPPRLELKKSQTFRKIAGNALLSHSPLPKLRRTSSGLSPPGAVVFRSDGGAAVTTGSGAVSDAGVAVDGASGVVTAGGSGAGAGVGGSGAGGVSGGVFPFGCFVSGMDLGGGFAISSNSSGMSRNPYFA